MITDIERLVAIEAIKALKARYCWYFDDPERYHLVPTLFTDDGVFIEEPLDELYGYVEEYRKVGEAWLFSRVHASGRWMTSFEEGLSETIDPEMFS